MDIRSFFGSTQSKKRNVAGNDEHELKTATAQAPATELKDESGPRKEATNSAPDETEISTKRTKREVIRSPAETCPEASPPNIDMQMLRTQPTPRKKPESAPTTQAAPPSSSSELPLATMKIAITGEFASMNRRDVEEMILQKGGKVSSSVTGKTDMLVIGNRLEDGRDVTEGRKYREALERKVPILTLDLFLSTKLRCEHSATSEAKAPSSLNTPNAFISNDEDRTTRMPLTLVNHGTDLWVDKHKPKALSELVGHGELGRKLGDWLRSWHKIHLSKQAPKSASYIKENSNAKAVLLSGPPGIGKSSLVHIVAHLSNFDVLELNASDTRNKSEIDHILQEAVRSQAISFTGVMKKQRLIIMDEVDGMGGSDRGGIAELIKMIKASMIPIVCICNDRQSPKVKSLANSCYDLRVKRPTKGQIASRLISIAAQEGLTVDPNAAEILTEQSGNDIRQAINALQMWRYHSNSLNFSNVRDNLSRIEKDKVLRLSPFDSCLQILSGGRADNSTVGADWNERYNAFFLDYSLVPLLIQQNYIDSAKNGIFRHSNLDDLAKMEKLSEASAWVSDMDIVGSKVRGQDQHWELLPTQAVMSLGVGHCVQGFQGFPTFPAWLGKYSSKNKSSRLLRELSQHSALSIGQGFQAMRLDYATYLRFNFIRPLVDKGKGAVEELIRKIEHYGFTKEDVMESLRELQMKLEKSPHFTDAYDILDTQVKSSLTRAYNSAGIISQTAVPELGARKKGTRSIAVSEDGAVDDDGAELLEKNDEDVDNEEDDAEALRAQLLKKSTTSNKNSKKKGTTAAKKK